MYLDISMDNLTQLARPEKITGLSRNIPQEPEKGKHSRSFIMLGIYTVTSTKLTAVAGVYSLFCTLIQHGFLEKI